MTIMRGPGFGQARLHTSIWQPANEADDAYEMRVDACMVLLLDDQVQAACTRGDASDKLGNKQTPQYSAGVRDGWEPVGALACIAHAWMLHALQYTCAGHVHALAMCMQLQHLLMELPQRGRSSESMEAEPRR